MRPIVLDVNLPAGADYYWQKACEFGEAGFSARELWFCTRGVPRSTVRSWLEGMVRRGHIQIVGMRFETRQPTNVYAVIRPTAMPPADMEQAYGQAQQQLWTAMRTLPQWTLSELAAAASTDTRPVTRNTAQQYITRLAAAGVLIRVRRSRGNVRDAAVWKLRKASDTGPLAPQRFKATFFFDPNRNEVIGKAEAQL